MLARPDGCIVRQRAESHINIGAVADDGVEKGAAFCAARIVGQLFPEDEQLITPIRHRELVSSDAGKRLEFVPV